MQMSGGHLRQPVQKLVATIVFAKGENANRVLPPQPTLRTNLDIGARNPVTWAVTGFFYPIFLSETG